MGHDELRFEVLGEAVPRNESESVTVAFAIPWTGPNRSITMQVRRGFVGRIALLEYGGVTTGGRKLCSAEFEGWDGDKPRFNYRIDSA